MGVMSILGGFDGNFIFDIYYFFKLITFKTNVNKSNNYFFKFEAKVWATLKLASSILNVNASIDDEK